MRPIDADELMKRVEDTDWYHINMRGKLTLGANPHHDTPLYKVVEILALINAAPTLDLEPVRTGHWHDETWYDDTIGRGRLRRAGYRCSKCWCGTAIKSNYCPRCGAKMDLKECE